MHVLTINCGSSTLKFQLLDLSHETGTVIIARRLARGIVDRIGEPAGTLVHAYVVTVDEAAVIASDTYRCVKRMHHL